MQTSPDRLHDPDEYALADLVTRVIDRGVLIQGDVTISVAGIDLVFVGLSVLLSSVETLREHGTHRVP